MKRIISLIAIILCLVACSNNNDNKDANMPTRDNDTNKQSEVTIANISDSNYEAVLKDAFGLEMSKELKFTITKATSPNKVNNVDIQYTYDEEINGKEIIESYFNECLKIGGVYQQNIDWDTLAISKGTSYTDFETCFNSEATYFDSFYSVMWLYDYKDKHVQFSLNIDGQNAELSLCYVTLDLEIDITDYLPQDGKGPEGWVWKEDYGFIDGVWDSEVLPTSFPKEIPGVKVEDTWYYAEGCENRLSGARVGDLYFDDYNFEQWQLTFDATNDQLLQFEQSLQDNGYIGNKEEDNNHIYATLTDGSVYLYYVLYESDREGYDWNVYCNMTILDYEYPQQFEGVLMPTFGLFEYEDANDGIIYAYDEDFNEIDFTYDFSGKGNQEVPPYILLWVSYQGVSRDQYDAYIDTLRNQGYTEWDEYPYGTTEGDYVTIFKYGNYYYGCYFNYDGNVNGVDFVVASETESMFY